MSDPKDLEEYTRFMHANQRFSGAGLDTTIHMPCYFCAAPDFTSWKIIEMESAASKPTTCKACGRSAKMIFTHDEHGGIHFEVVQTGGPDHADYLPKMARVS